MGATTCAPFENGHVMLDMATYAEWYNVLLSTLRDDNDKKKSTYNNNRWHMNIHAIHLRNPERRNSCIWPTNFWPIVDLTWNKLLLNNKRVFVPPKHHSPTDHARVHQQGKRVSENHFILIMFTNDGEQLPFRFSTTHNPSTFLRCADSLSRSLWIVNISASLTSSLGRSDFRLA